MISGKYITKIAAGLMALSVILCLSAMIYADSLTEMTGGMGIAMEYPSLLFDRDEIVEINIVMEDADWKEMLANARTEEYCRCDVDINGTQFYSVGIRPKGNTSLTSIASDPDTDRYSFKLEFDWYVEGQNCFGLDKLVLNNNYADATNMKEAIVYDMYQYLDTDASLYNYARVSVNGEYWGLYLALEAVEDSFMLRNYGTENGKLYKPDSMNMGGGFSDRKFGDMQGDVKMPQLPEGVDGSEIKMPQMPGGGDENRMPPMPGNGNGMPQMPGGGDENGMPQIPDGIDENEMPQMPGPIGENGSERREMGGFSRGGGSDLNYTDDDLDSYSTIWDASITDSNKADHKRVVKALKNISEGKDLENSLDIENILKYMAVHTFAVNLDSFTGTMTHNYYLYEADGKLNILPWDYNLAFGGMTMGHDTNSASEIINYPVDTPFSGTEFFDALLEDETYLAKYHSYLKQLTKEYISGGIFEKSFTQIRSQIDSLVKTDPTAFYTYEEYEAGAQMLYDTILLRSESIQGQLEGTIPSTSEEQKENASLLINADEIDLKTMGSMNMEWEEEGENRKGRPQDMGFPGMQMENTFSKQNLLLYAGYAGIMAVSLLFVGCYRRKRRIHPLADKIVSGKESYSHLD